MKSTLENLLPRICSVLNAQYLSFHFSGPDNFYVTNNDAEYIEKVYLPIQREDHLKRGMLEKGDPFVISRNPECMRKPENRDFNETCLKARFISDQIYAPLSYMGHFRGFWGLAKASKKDPEFSDDELALSSFLFKFINDAFERSLLPPAPEATVAYLNSETNILKAGDIIKDAFEQLRKMGSWTVIQNAVRKYLEGPLRPGRERFTAIGTAGPLVFQLSPFRTEEVLGGSINHPSIQVRLLSEPAAAPGDLDFAVISESHGLTPREEDIVRCIFRAMSNKQIAYELKIQESTVKRHTHNIYEKTGLFSRTELILNLSRNLPITRPATY